MGVKVGSLDEETIVVAETANDEEGSLVEVVGSSGEEMADGVKTIDDEDVVDVAEPIDSKENWAPRSSN